MSILMGLSPLSSEPQLAISMPGVWEWVVILGVVLLIFGPKNLPGLGEAIGKSIRGFKRAVKEDEIDVTPSSSSGQLPEGTSRASMPHAEEQKSHSR